MCNPKWSFIFDAPNTICYTKIANLCNFFRLFKSIFWSEKRNYCIFIAALVKFIIEKCFQSWVHNHLSTICSRKFCCLKKQQQKWITPAAFIESSCDHSKIMVMKLKNCNIQNHFDPAKSLTSEANPAAFCGTWIFELIFW